MLFSFGENETNVQTIFHTNETGLVRAFELPKGVTAIVGGGGKTTLMLRLARELAESGARVIVTTTTHIFPPDGIRTLTNGLEDEVELSLKQNAAVCIGKPTEASKLAAPDLPISRMAELADYVLVEADGAKRLPLKAPAGHEPVIPPEARLVIASAGLEGAGKPIYQAAFRPERFAALCGKLESDEVTAKDIALVLAHPGGLRKNVADGVRFAVLLNQADDEPRRKTALEIASLLQQYPIERTIIASLGE